MKDDRPSARSMGLCTIYKLTNTLNGKVYVGQTWQSLGARWMAHKRGGCRALHAAITRHSPSVFTVSLLTVASTQRVADYWESFFITAFDSISIAAGYNLKEGGSHGRHSLTAKLQRSVAMLGNTRCVGHRAPPEVGYRIAAAKRALRLHVSEEHKKRLSLAKKGVPLAPEHAAKVRAACLARRGTKASDEARLHMSAAQKGRVVTPEHRARLAASLRGRSPSKETLAKAADTRRRHAAAGVVFRFRRGEQIPCAKLREVDVIAMRRRHSAGESYGSLGRAYGVAWQVARNACLGVTWKHVPMPPTTAASDSATQVSMPERIAP